MQPEKTYKIHLDLYAIIGNCKMKLIVHTDYSIIKNEIGKNQIYEV